MILFDPLIDERLKLACLLQQFVRLRFRRHLPRVVVDRISLAAAGLEVVSVRRSLFAQRRLPGFEGLLVTAQSCAHPVAGTGYRRFRQSEDGVIGDGEAPIRREPGQTGICHITCDELVQGKGGTNGLTLLGFGKPIRFLISEVEGFEAEKLGGG